MCGTVTITKTRQEMEKEKQCLMDQLPAKGLGVIHNNTSRCDPLQQSSHPVFPQ